MILDIGEVEKAIEEASKEPAPRVFVTVTDSYKYNKNNSTVTRYNAIRTLKSLSEGYNFLEADIEECGAELVMKSFTNLESVSPGRYEVIYYNTRYDSEGYAEEWQYKLIPFEEGNVEK